MPTIIVSRAYAVLVTHAKVAQIQKTGKLLSGLRPRPSIRFDLDQVRIWHERYLICGDAIPPSPVLGRKQEAPGPPSGASIFRAELILGFRVIEKDRDKHDENAILSRRRNCRSGERPRLARLGTPKDA